MEFKEVLSRRNIRPKIKSTFTSQHEKKRGQKGNVETARLAKLRLWGSGGAGRNHVQK